MIMALFLLMAGQARSQNPIVTENSLPGNPRSEWDITGAGDMSIQGFATDISVNKGTAIRFKINVDGTTTYTIRIYRLGWYQGNGARLIEELGPFNGISQPSPVSDQATGLVDCGNWAESASWNVPASAVSGVYIARLIRTDTGGASHVVFVVRDDSRNAGLLFKTSDATWQAYNVYGGNSLYTGSTTYPNGHAVKVSYNRPFVTRQGGGGGGEMEDWLFNAEYPMIRWLERNGYDMVYSTDLDMERDQTPITPARYKAMLSVGHDEYWSLAERTRWENARDAGVHLAFFSGNEVYWKTRWENSIDGSGTPHRTLVCYKEGDLGENICGDKCDPLPDVWTGLWRSGCQYAADGCRPENALTGQISWTESTGSILVTDEFKDLPVWRNTSIATLGAGQSVTFPNGTLGYEWDPIQPEYASSYPAGRQALSRTTLGGQVHELSLYRHSSGALVFGAGTIQWSWGLDDVHDRGNAAPSRDMQQATVNLLSDMDVQPGSLQSDLVPGIPENDTVPPVSQITFPENGTVLASQKSHTISGTATDSGGGIVSRVEVSTDNGAIWQTAQGNTSWSFAWIPADTGSVTIRARATDNSGNVEPAGSSPGITVQIGPASHSIWPASAMPVRVADPDMVPIEVGVKFRPRVNGYITGIRFYKAATNTGTHIGSLWTSAGSLLSRATFSGESSSGWQEVQLPAPVPVTAGATYIASYHTTVGQYSSDEAFFATSGVSTPYLEALANGVAGDNGVYTYSATPAFPTQGYRSTNFWVDVSFTVDNVVDTTPPAVSTTTPLPGAQAFSPVSAVSVRFSEPLDPASVNATAFQLRDSLDTVVPATVTYDAASWTASLKPAAPLSGESDYTAAIAGGTIRDLSGNVLQAAYSWSFRTSKEVFSIWTPDDVPVRDADPDQQPVEVGMKFRPLINGFITGIRYYKSAGNTGTHVGSLWTRTGVRLAQATFAGETPTGWQEVQFDSPVEVTAGTVYVVSYHTNAGQYASDTEFFTQSVTTPYLEALQDGLDGPNGVYRYTAEPAFPTEGYLASNFWVDVLFVTSVGPDTSPPQILVTTPLNGDTGVSPATSVSAVFNESLDSVSVGSTSFELRDAGGNLLVAEVTYQASGRTAVLTPAEPLAYNSTYTATIKGLPDGVRDRAGNILAADHSWTFGTGGPPPVPPAEGPGGPILVVSTATNPFSRYPVELLRAEGLNAFTARDISQVTAQVLTGYDVVILGEVPLTAAQVTMFTDWTLSGGTFIALRPDAKLAPLLGITRGTGTLTDRYLRVNTAAGPGAGIVGETIQYHGPADLYTLNGATAIATLYSAAATPTANPAVTMMSAGQSGGRAIAFTYDLARSVVYTRQGNPAWAGQERDGQSGPIRANDMFFGDASFDPQPDWIDLDKVAIPQADEQQRLLANLVIQSSLHRKPLPRFWYLPRGLKAAVVMTGDDHGNGGTAARFTQYRNLSPSNTPDAVADWTAIRGTSYIYPGTPLTNQQTLQLQQEGFELALHLNTNCAGFTAGTLTASWDSQEASLRAQLPGLNLLASNRTHCMPWPDWATQAKVQAARGVRIDVNYYYWPGAWIQDRPGMFTGSGMPMRFADLDGTIIDCYQVPTQITDESGISSYTAFINALLDKAKGPEGYYGVFCANMHTDNASSQGSDEIINSALARQIPVVSAKQMLDWLDGRNNSSFGSLAWQLNRLSFAISAAAGSRNMKAMLPDSAATGKLTGLTLNGTPVAYTLEKIKGMNYAFFDALPGDYEATYGTACLASDPADTSVTSFTRAGFTTGPAVSGATYQWQVSTDNGATFTGITDNDVYSGAQTAALTLTGVTRELNGYRYRCVIGGICQLTTAAAMLTVTKAVQTISWNAPTAITYGTPISALQLNATVSGTPGAGAPGALSYTPAAGTRLNAGTQTLSVTAAETDDYLPATASVSLTVDRRPVSAGVAVSSRTYDGSTAAQIASVTLTGVMEGDELAGSGGTAIFADRHAGTGKTVTISGLTLTGTSASNYSLEPGPVTALADVLPLPVAGSFTVANKAYSGTTSAIILTRTVAGTLPADTVSLWGGTAEFDDPSVGTGKTVTGTGIRLGGTYPGNYRLEPDVLTTQANITPRTVTGSIKVSNKVYDGTTDAEISSSSLSGLLAADAGQVTLTGGTARFTSSSAGSKRVLASGFSLSGPAAGNYSLLTSSFSAMASITKRPVTVTARSGQTKIGGTPDPVFTYDVTAGSLVSGDAFTGALSRTPGEAAGTYPILRGTLALSGNYELTYQGAAFIITDPVLSQVNPAFAAATAAQVTVTQGVRLSGYPNPFARTATAEFILPEDEPHVILALYDLRGQQVSELYAGPASAGRVYRFTIRGAGMPPGAYFIRLSLRQQTESFRIIMLE